MSKFKNNVHNFSFSLRETNVLEGMILDKLNVLIENGCSKKDAIMTLMVSGVENLHQNKQNMNFIKFIKDEIPDVYAKLKQEFKRERKF